MEKVANLLSTAGAVILGGGLFFKTFFYTVDSGYRAVVFNKLKGGIQDTIIGEGMHFYIPGLYVPFFSKLGVNRCNRNPLSVKSELNPRLLLPSLVPEISNKSNCQSEFCIDLLKNSCLPS